MNRGQPLGGTGEAEFWWLDAAQSHAQIFCRLAQVDASDEDVDAPLPRPRGATLVTKRGRDTLITAGENQAIFLPSRYAQEWWDLWNGTNVHRSSAVSLDGDPHRVIEGPILLDFDGDEWDQDDVRRLRQPRNAAVKVLRWAIAEFHLAESDVRCYFSGRKGFHLELRPERITAALADASEATDPVRTLLRRVRRASILDPEEQGFDPPKTWKRLANSINAWQQAGHARAMRRIALTLDQLSRADLGDILSAATVD